MRFLQAAWKDPGVLLFLWLLLFFALGTCGYVFPPDGVVMGLVTKSLVQGEGPAVNLPGIPPEFVFPGTDGQLYGKYGPGLSYLAVPFALKGQLLRKIAPSHAVDLFSGPKFLWYRAKDPNAVWHFFALSFTNAVVVAATCWLLFALLVQLGFPVATALAGAAVAGLASPLWPYARDFFAEPLGGLGILAFVFFAERFRSRPVAARSLPAGLALGLTAVAKAGHLILFPAAAALFAYILWRNLKGARERLAQGGWFALGVAFMLALVAAFNLARFGTITATGYEGELNRWTTPAWTGLKGLLISPGRGLLPHFPIVLVSVLMTRSMYRRSPHLTLFTWAALLSLVLFYCRWHAWFGGWCWGPRFLVPVIPLLVVLAAPLLDATARGGDSHGGNSRGGGTAGALKVLGGLCLLASFWIALSGTLVPATEFHQRAQDAARGGPWAEQLLSDWRFFTPVAYWSFEPKLGYFFPKLLRIPSGWWLAGLFGFGLVWLAPLGWRILQLARGAAPARAIAAAKTPAWRRSMWILWGSAALLLAGVFSWTSRAAGPHVMTHFDFEQDRYASGWTVEGEAFGTGPAQGIEGRTPARGAEAGAPERRIIGFTGLRLVNSAESHGDGARGALRSPEFTIRGDQAAFLLGGAHDPEHVFVRLMVDGREVARSTGKGSDALAPQVWDVSTLWGRRARLEWVDQSTESGGHLLFDDFRIFRLR